MNLSDPVAAIEIGTANTTIAIGEPAPDNGVKIAALTFIPSSGVQKSVIVDMGQIHHSITNLLRRLVDNHGYAIGHAHLAVGGPHVLAKPVSAQLQLLSGSVQEEDLLEIEERSISPELPPDRQALECHLVSYSLDNNPAPLLNPKGMSGRLLTRSSLCIHADAHRIADAINAAADCRLEIANYNVAFTGTCAAAAVLTPQMQRDGALVVELGAGSTACTAWADGSLVWAEVIGVGGEHVTRDIASGFSIQRNQAEQIKVAHASATLANTDPSARFPLPNPPHGSNNPSLSLHALNTIVNARLDELFTIIRTKLDEAGVLHRIRGGVWLTGGGSSLPGIEALASSVFGIPAKTASLLPKILGLESCENPAQYAAVAGLLLNAVSSAEPSSAVGSLKKFFKGLFSK